jgi:predicted NAD-dependent protein-ADP-ribosyltransferase YbiA (DUF1768 family)
MNPANIDVTYADMECAACGFHWRQCEVNKGFATITSDCPACHGKAKTGAPVIWSCVAAGVGIVWSELEIDKLMDIGSKSGYPSSALSNFAPHPFEIDGIQVCSMEGWLQSIKFKAEPMQRHVCTLVGITAKRRGAKKHWQESQTLWWKGMPYKRESEEYQALLDRAYAALAKNDGFRRALLASGDSVLTHTMGRTNPKETVLTQAEFCGRLTRLRAIAKMEERKCSG